MFNPSINPKTQLKLPKGVFKAASNNRALNELRFYYKLKSRRIDGCFTKGNVLRPIATELNVSESTVCRGIARLVKKGFAFYDANQNLCLVKYDTAWQVLNIKTKNLKLFKVDPKSWEVDYIYKELKKNFAGQRRAIQRKRQDTVSSKPINFDVSLSYAGIAKIFGVSSNKAFRMIKLLEISNMITVVRRRKFIGNGSSSDFLTFRKFCGHGYQKGKAFFRSLPNQIVFKV